MPGANPLSYITSALDEIKAAGGFFRLRQLQSACEPVCRADGREVINLASNNYLGLANHPKLKEAAEKAVREFGVGSGAVRTITGTLAMHIELEEKIAAFKHTEACVVFQSGFTANAGAVSSVLTPNDHIISDALNHASIIDGCRLSRAKIHVFRHRDAAHAGEILSSLASEPGNKLLITDGVFSMDGDIGPLDQLVPVAEKHGAIMMIDDAHSSGVLGANGRGTVDHFGLHGRVQIQVGTLSKAIGALGGYVCGSRDLIDYLYHRARPFLFSTSHPPAVTAACLAAFDLLAAEPERVRLLWDNTNYFKQLLKQEGFDTGLSETPIVPIIVGETKAAMDYSRALFDAGLWATGIGFPTVPQGLARIRAIVTATHSRAQLEQSVDILKRVATRMGLPLSGR
ncbi:MAG: 8-amino-7-oxononanoate synthase [Candidatus Solibacter sp.]|nr:8-amino-7-oxononanoate synthase [Candidatus Solibacter sp.]